MRRLVALLLRSESQGKEEVGPGYKTPTSLTPQSLPAELYFLSVSESSKTEPLARRNQVFKPKLKVSSHVQTTLYTDLVRLINEGYLNNYSISVLS